jgi:hypothetical protein
MKQQIKYGAERRKVRDNLEHLSKHARDMAIAKTRFKQLQQRVLSVFSSDPCQTFLALLIFAVHFHATSSLKAISISLFPSV